MVELLKAVAKRMLKGSAANQENVSVTRYGRVLEQTAAQEVTFHRPSPLVVQVQSTLQVLQGLQRLRADRLLTQTEYEEMKQDLQQDLQREINEAGKAVRRAA